MKEYITTENADFPWFIGWFKKCTKMGSSKTEEKIDFIYQKALMIRFNPNYYAYPIRTYKCKFILIFHTE